MVTGTNVFTKMPSHFPGFPVWVGTLITLNLESYTGINSEKETLLNMDRHIPFRS